MSPSNRQFVHDMLIAFGGLVVLFPLLAYASLERRRRWLTPFVQLLDGQAGEQTGTFDWTLRGHFEHRPVTIKISSAGRYGDRSFRFGLLCPAGTKFDLLGERPLSEMRRKIGLLRDLKNGFEVLDGAYVFHASDPERFRALLQEPSARRSVQVLFYDQQMDRVWLNEGVLWCGYSGKEMPEVGEVRQLLDALFVFAESLEEEHDGPWTGEEPGRAGMPRGFHPGGLGRRCRACQELVQTRCPLTAWYFPAAMRSPPTDPCHQQLPRCFAPRRRLTLWPLPFAWCQWQWGSC